VTKRIALCWEIGQVPEPREGLSQWAKHYSQGCVFVYPIYREPELVSWMPGIGGIFCLYEAVLHEPSPVPVEPMASQIANADAIKAGLAEADALRISGEPFDMLPEYYQMAIDSTGSREAADADILLDARDEAFIQRQVCCMLGCSNVATADVLASEKLNKKPKARGNQPFFSYKVLALTNEKQPKS